MHYEFKSCHDSYHLLQLGNISAFCFKKAPSQELLGTKKVFWVSEGDTGLSTMIMSQLLGLKWYIDSAPFKTRASRAEFGPLQSDYGGEDAFFTSPVGGGAFGVADGVGGWQDSGINPAGLLFFILARHAVYKKVEA